MKDKLQEAYDIINALVYYSQIHTVEGVVSGDLTHEEAWKKGRQILHDNCIVVNGNHIVKQDL